MTTSTRTNAENPPQTQAQTASRQKIIGAVGLLAIIALGAFLRFYQLGAYTIGNTYYAAAVKSMLTSWSNFFYVAFEPGGSVTVDKPPLGFWVQAISAYFFGVNGFALALPQALAGTLSIPVLYHLVRKRFGVWVGLASALVLALMPVTIATERNNTIDGLLVFVLLLATWAFLKATETGKTRFLLMGAILVGLGFNIKMLQAYMVLPAFYAVYFIGASVPWWKRILQLGVATIVLLIVSFAWVAAVDLTPSEERPYVGSSQNNTVLELIIGHNGLSRLGLNDRGPRNGDGPRAADGQQPGPAPGDGGANQPAGGFAPLAGNPAPGAKAAKPPREAIEACNGLGIGDACTVNLPNGDIIAGDCYSFPQGDLVCVPEGRTPPPQPLTPNSLPLNSQPGNPSAISGRGMNSNETGAAGVLRLFGEPLVTEASWLLPFLLLGLPVALVAAGWSWPLSDKHVSLLLWTGWLLPSMSYFSFTTGLFHRYYLIMLGPPVAALVGVTFWGIARHWKQNHALGWLLTAFLSGATIIFEIYVFRTYTDYSGRVTAISLLIWLVGMGVLALSKLLPIRKAGLALMLAALMVAPFTWSALTTLNTNPNVALPTAGIEASDQTRASNMTPNQEFLNENGQAILAYTLANTDPDSYLLATNNAREAAPYILEVGRPVLTFGGFTGKDNVVDLENLIAMIESDELRYILGLPQNPEIARWIEASCSVADVPGFDASQAQPVPPGPGQRPGAPGGQRDQQSQVLYDCGG
ncbi:MAG: glycosyltransferase family 39 protein [Chloroflexi bacterium]|nr:glycosyltransferase family 39 protein [Chloroflexota bacterium]